MIIAGNINWTSFALYALLSAGPTLAWLFLCLWFDRSSPEPSREILRVFCWGCIITLPLIFITGPLSDLVERASYLGPILTLLILSFLIDGVIEESAKCAMLITLIYRSRWFDESRDGMVYGMTLGLGLAFVENILYGVIAGQEGLTLAVATVLTRGITTTFMHFLAGGIIGYWLGLAKFYRRSVRARRLTIIYGLGLAVIFHGLYNTIVRFGQNWIIYPLGILLIAVYIYILRGIREFSLKTKRRS